MGNHHDAFEAFSPVEWDQIPQDDLAGFIQGIFADAQQVIESVPSPHSKLSSSSNADADTDNPAAPDSKTPLDPSQALDREQAEQLRKEWKEAKVNAKDNPLGINVYKLSSKDGKGAWFARQSVHEGLTFEQWKAGLEREFSETMKVQGGPGSGSIRGIGADQKVATRIVDGVGQMNVFQLSAQFPGPTTPRDFITLLLSSSPPSTSADGTGALRQYMVVSKPCVHPDSPPRQGIIRGQYESVEIIREVPSAELPPKRSLSSNSLPDHPDRAQDDQAKPSSNSQGHGGASAVPANRPPLAIEWVMITRSDPGGSVPRFMIEKGTPPGIVGDSDKFLTWLKTRSAEGFADTDTTTKDTETVKAETQDKKEQVQVTKNEEPNDQLVESGNRDFVVCGNNEARGASSDFFGSVSGAVGAAGSAVATGLRRQFDSSFDSRNDEAKQVGTSDPDEQQDSVTTPSDTSSVGSFASAEEGNAVDGGAEGSVTGSRSDESQLRSNNSHEKELRKLEERRKKLDAKVAKMQERLEQKRQSDNQKDAAALAKAREKNDKELAKQEARYRRELKKLEDKRESEERKAEARRRRMDDRDEKKAAAAASLELEAERARAERDVALKQVQLLQSQVGALREQNAKLVARLDKATGLNGPSASAPDLDMG